MRNLIFLAALVVAAPVEAQVGISPSSTAPAAWERFAIRVMNQTDTATVQVRVQVPSVILILGVQPMAGWSVETTPATDTLSQSITWSGGKLTKGQFDEFAFLGRLDPNAKPEDLGFPVRIQRANGSVVEWRRQPGEDYAAPRVQIVGTATISPTGQVAMAGAALGFAIIAIVFAIALGVKKR